MLQFNAQFIVWLSHVKEETFGEQLAEQFKMES